MRNLIALSCLATAAIAVAQPVVTPRTIDPALSATRPIPALTRERRAARIAAVLKPYSGDPLSGAFQVGMGLPVPEQAASFEMSMVRSLLQDSGGSLVTFLTGTTKTPVDVLRPMIGISLKPHAKPYLADCALTLSQPPQQAGYFITGQPTYHSKIFEKKSIAAVEDGHMLFAVPASAGPQHVYLTPLTLDPGKAFSLRFDRCEFSQVG